MSAPREGAAPEALNLGLLGSGVLLNWARMRASGVVLIAVLFSGCAPNSGKGGGPAEAKLPRSDAPAGARPMPAATVADLGWIQAVREQRWADAARVFDAVEPAPAAPELRYARARIALSLSDYPRALRLLEGLETELAPFAEEIRGHRAHAQLEHGPHLPAARYFLARGDAAALVNAAIGYERAGDLPRADSTIQRAFAAIRKLKSVREQRLLEARARVVRARLARAKRHVALAVQDLKWIATTVPASPEAAEIDRQFAELGAKLSFSAKERYDRALSLAERGLVTETDHELSLLGKSVAPGFNEGDLVHARAWAVYMSRKDDAQAAELFERAARLGSRDVGRDLFYAAKAASRAGQFSRATATYDELAKRFPKTRLFEQARYQAARTEYIAGNWTEAALRYAAYLARFGKNGRFFEEAGYELAVAELAAEKWQSAAPRLAKLAAEASDDRERNALLELEAVALLGSGRRDDAVSRFTTVMREQPLSLFALLSQSRLKMIGAPLPPLIEPPEARSAEPGPNLELPYKAQLLQRLGFDDDAEREIVLAEPELKKLSPQTAGRALCELYSGLFGAARRYRLGQQLIRAEALDIAPSDATRWAWDCVYPRPYGALVGAFESEWQLPPHLVYAVMRQESGFQPGALSPVSAVGLMQLMPNTAARAASEIGMRYVFPELTRPATNIRLGAFYLSRVLRTFGAQVPLAAAAYNAGPVVVSQWLNSGEQLPLDLFVARIPYRETRTYVARVVGNWARYTYLNDGPDAVPSLPLDIPRGLRAEPDAY